MSVVTRFAPSPTGFLHIGGARTALFNWLFARRHGGAYLLRIEDTDRVRSTQAAIDTILSGLDWLGLGADDAPVFQFARAERHRAVAEEMIRRGSAFRCYLDAEEVERARAEAQAAGRAFRSPWRDGGSSAPDKPFVVRLRAPDTGEVLNDDLVQGPVRVKAADIDDLILLRADGVPTYMHAVVVDDHDMGVTHIIRGDDHLTNAARQIPIFAAMGWEPPRFAHVPMIHGPDGAKLSKRHGALGVEAYRDMGYLPEGLLNYLMRLGWSYGDREIISLDEAAAVFDLANVGRAPARLDLAKLDFVNAHYMKTAENGRLATLLLDFVATQRDWPLDTLERDRLVRAVTVLKHRAKTLADLAEQSFFLVRRRPIALDVAAQKAMKEEVVERLRRLLPRLQAMATWEEADLAQTLKDFAAAERVGLGQIGPGLRALLTGGAVSPDLGSTLALLGREESLARIADGL
ncbi:MAG: glutamate--tRNA ligase [Hyphomonadaceae bacterium]|nr:glutamate--tRNA ligase [Hyphomonadaceae bacterium]